MKKLVNDLKIEEMADGKWVVKQQGGYGSLVVLSTHKNYRKAYLYAEKKRYEKS